MHSFTKPTPSAALAAMHEADQQHGINPLLFTPASGPAHPGSGPGLYIAPVDWRQEAPVRDVVSAMADTEALEDTEPRPKPKAAKPPKTPNLDKVRRWLEQDRRP